MAVDVGRAFGLAWRLAPRLPETLVRGVLDLAFRAAARRRGGGFQQLRANYARLRPEASAAELDGLARQGMREYGRYYAEAFLLPKFAAPELLQDRVRVINQPRRDEPTGEGSSDNNSRGGNSGGKDSRDNDSRGGNSGGEGSRGSDSRDNDSRGSDSGGNDSGGNGSSEGARPRSVVLALGHTGNWDIAGAWVSAFHAPVLTVAEKLEPESLFREFLRFRESLGMEVIALERGQNVFRQLVSRAITDRRAVCLLADRDLTLSGIEVELAGEKALFAAGPAAVALAARIPLYFVGLRSDRITGRDGRKRWGIEIEFVGPFSVPEAVGGRRLETAERVALLTQAWVDALTAHILKYPTSWHMLQKVFVADLDPERLARRGKKSSDDVEGASHSVVVNPAGERAAGT